MGSESGERQQFWCIFIYPRKLQIVDVVTIALSNMIESDGGPFLVSAAAASSVQLLATRLSKLICTVQSEHWKVGWAAGSAIELLSELCYNRRPLEYLLRFFPLQDLWRVVGQATTNVRHNGGLAWDIICK